MATSFSKELIDKILLAFTRDLGRFADGNVAVRVGDGGLFNPE
jgi:hypothetical protein